MTFPHPMVNTERPAGTRRIRRPLGLQQLEYRNLMAIDLIPGQIASGTISSAGEVDEYSFFAESGDKIELLLTSTSSGAGFTSRGQIFRPNGDLLDTFLHFQGNRSHELPERGTYTVRVFDDNQDATGSYTLGLEGIAPISPDAVPVIKGGITSGEIGESIEKDQFTFHVHAGDKFEIWLTSEVVRGSFSARGELFSPEGTRIDTFLYFQGNRRHTAGETGVYMIQIRDDDLSSKGRYTLGWEGISPVSPDPIPLVKGGIVASSIDAPIEKKQFTFDAHEGDKIDLILTSTNGSGSFDARAELFAPNGEPIDTFLHFQGNRRLTLTATGKYMLQVRDEDAVSLGSFEIGLEGLRPISPGAVVLSGTSSVSGTISRPIQKDQFKFHGTEGELVELQVIDLPTQGMITRTELFSPTGDLIDTFVASQGRRFHTLQDTGEYLIQVRDENYSRLGGYRLQGKFGGAELPWHNPTAPHDVNADTFVSPLDALLVINELTNHRFSSPDDGSLNRPTAAVDTFFDVNGDSFVSPIDALLVINNLPTNTDAVGQREGNLITAMNSQGASGDLDTSCSRRRREMTFANLFDFNNPG